MESKELLEQIIAKFNETSDDKIEVAKGEVRGMSDNDIKIDIDTVYHLMITSSTRKCILRVSSIVEEELYSKMIQLLCSKTFEGVIRGDYEIKQYT